MHLVNWKHGHKEVRLNMVCNVYAGSVVNGLLGAHVHVQLKYGSAILDV